MLHGESDRGQASPRTRFGVGVSTCGVVSLAPHRLLHSSPVSVIDCCRGPRWSCAVVLVPGRFWASSQGQGGRRRGSNQDCLRRGLGNWSDRILPQPPGVWVQKSEREKPQRGGMSQHSLIEPHATSQPSLLSPMDTHSLTAQPTQPLTMPHIHVPSWHQHWHCKTSVITQTLITRDDQPTPAVHLSSPPLHRHRSQLHCPAHKCTLGKRPPDVRSGAHTMAQ